MPTECNPSLFEFAPVAGHAVVAAFDDGVMGPGKDSCGIVTHLPCDVSRGNVGSPGVHKSTLILAG